MLNGIDISHWQGRMNWAQAIANGASFGFFKACDWNMYTRMPFTDTQFVNNWNGTRDQNLINGGYHWLQPKVDPKVQALYYLELISKYPTDFLILDFEEVNVNSWSDALWRAQVWLEIVRDALPNKPLLVYTGKWYIDKFDQQKAGFLGQYLLWHAQYTTWPFATIPKIWKNWTFWQYTAHGPGKDYGAESKDIDVNRFDGTIDDLRFLANKTEPVDPPAPPEPVDPPDLTSGDLIFEVVSETLNIRSGPGTSYPAVGKLMFGDQVTVTDIGGNSSWAKLQNGWCAVEYSGVRYLKRVD